MIKNKQDFIKNSFGFISLIGLLLFIAITRPSIPTWKNIRSMRVEQVEDWTRRIKDANLRDFMKTMIYEKEDDL